MSKISGYSNSVSSLGNDDLMDVSEKISSSPDVYESRKMTGAVLAAFIQTFSNDSIYSASGTVPSSIDAAITDFLRFSGGRLDLSTTTDGFLMPRLTTAQMNAVSAPTTDLLIFNTDFSALYRYDGVNWKPFAGYGVLSISDSEGSKTYYSDLTSAFAAFTAGDVIEQHADIIETGAVTLGIPNGLKWNMNGHKYEQSNATGSCVYDLNAAVEFDIYNGEIKKSTGGSYALYVNNPSTVGRLHNVLLNSTFGICLYNDGEVIGGRGTNSAGVQGVDSDGILRNFYFDGFGYIIINNTNARAYNCYSKSSGTSGFVIANGELHNSIGESSSSYGIDLRSAKLFNCTGLSSANHGIYSASSGAVMYDCRGRSTSGGGIYLNNIIDVYDSIGESSTTYGLRGNGTSFYGCTGISSAAAGVFFNPGAGAECIETKGISTLNTTSGHGIEVTSNTGRVVACYGQTINAGAYAFNGTGNAYMANNTGHGMTVLINPSLTQSNTSTADVYGNILVD